MPPKKDTEIVDDIVIDTGKPFRFQSKAAILTYKHHLNKEEYCKWFNDNIGEVENIVIGHESGDKTHNYLHTHVVFLLKKAADIKNARAFDYTVNNENIHPHVQKFTPKGKILRDYMMYVCKEDPDNAELLEKLKVEKSITIVKGEITKDVWACATLQDAMMLCTKASDATGIRCLWDAKIRSVSLDPEDIPSQDWQKWVIEERKDPPNAAQRRMITWICDVVGGCGKTILARYLAITQPDKWRCAGDLGTVRDAATTVKGWLDSGWTGHGIIVDLPRQVAKHDSRIYLYLEAIKNGIMSAQKYAGSTVIFPKPHLIVFANWEPNYTAISKSMWDSRLLVPCPKTKKIIFKQINIDIAYKKAEKKKENGSDDGSDCED